MITSPTTVHHPLPALLSNRQNWEDHSLSLLSYAFGWSWLTEDLIRASGDGGRIRTVSVGLTPSLWVAGWMGHDWLAVSGGGYNSTVPSLEKCLVVSLLPTYAFSSGLFINPSPVILICMGCFLLISR